MCFCQIPYLFSSQASAIFGDLLVGFRPRRIANYQWSMAVDNPGSWLPTLHATVDGQRPLRTSWNAGTQSIPVDKPPTSAWILSIHSHGYPVGFWLKPQNGTLNKKTPAGRLMRSARRIRHTVAGRPGCIAAFKTKQSNQHLPNSCNMKWFVHQPSRQMVCSRISFGRSWKRSCFGPHLGEMKCPLNFFGFQVVY